MIVCKDESGRRVDCPCHDEEENDEFQEETFSTQKLTCCSVSIFVKGQELNIRIFNF